MHTKLAIIDYLRRLAEALANAPHGGKEPLYQQAMRDLGCCRQEVFKRLKEVRVSARKQRADKGESALTREEAQTISAVLLESMRANGKRLLSFEDAVDLARQNGLIKAERMDMETGEVRPLTADTIARRLRQYGLHPDQVTRPAPHVQLASLHPNHVWQIDASICVLYYLRGGKRLAVMDAAEFYKNKPQNFDRIANERLIRYSITDHYSGTIYVRYVMGSESGENLAQVFIDAIQLKDDAREPFHGVPLQIMLDPGSANIGHLFTNLCRRLQVRPLVNEPGQPRSKGQVENSHNLIERSFESRLRFKGIDSLDELNALAATWRRWYNGTREHSRHGHTRYALWQTIRADQLRIAPPRALCELLLTTKPEPRTVDGELTISYAIKGYGSNRYSVSHIPNILVGEKVDVCINPWNVPSVNVIEIGADGQEVLFLCQPLEMNSAGFRVDAPVIGERYAAAADTPADTARKAGLKEAYDAGTLGEAEDARKRKRTPTFGKEGGLDPYSYMDEQTTAQFMPRRGTALGVDAVPVTHDRPLTISAAAMALVKRGVEMTPTRRTQIETWYPDGVPESELEALMARITANAPLRAVG